MDQHLLKVQCYYIIAESRRACFEASNFDGRVWAMVADVDKYIIVIYNRTDRRTFEAVLYIVMWDLI